MRIGVILPSQKERRKCSPFGKILYRAGKAAAAKLFFREAGQMI